MMWKRILRTVLALSILAGVSYAAQEAPSPVKLGLDSLVRPEAATNFSLGSFSFTPGNDERRILFRLRPSVTVTPSENLTARVEGQWYAFYDDTDFSIFSLYQGYVEGVLPGVKGVSLKAGRQEFVYGSTFLLGADTFYDGLTFDAAKLSWKPAEKFSLDLFGGRYVKKWAGGHPGETLRDLRDLRSQGNAFDRPVRPARHRGSRRHPRRGGARTDLVRRNPAHREGRQRGRV